MKHNPLATANALAVTGVILYTVCRVLVGLFPETSLVVAQSWFHGMQLTNSSWNLTAASFVLGLLSFAIAAWLTGYVFALVYNYFERK